MAVAVGSGCRGGPGGSGAGGVLVARRSHVEHGVDTLDGELVGLVDHDVLGPGGTGLRGTRPRHERRGLPGRGGNLRAHLRPAQHLGDVVPHGRLSRRPTRRRVGHRAPHPRGERGEFPIHGFRPRSGHRGAGGHGLLQPGLLRCAHRHRDDVSDRGPDRGDTTARRGPRRGGHQRPWCARRGPSRSRPCSARARRRPRPPHRAQP